MAQAKRARIKEARPVVGRRESSAANLPADVRKELDARLARIEGHVSAIRRMLAAGDDCDSLLVQASAVRSALNGVLVGLMEEHLTSCVIPCAKGNHEDALDRFRQALETVLKRS
ncbi:MAG TPA: metal-sensitive transcriptional regulator [Thermoanaerobaculia bacterium]|nr:metal-sensitive transcriptional regulator [Thermoanaerobaculia bacterium]